MDTREKKVRHSCSGYGSLVGTARIMQDGHFLSNVLWAGGLVYLSGEVLAQVMGLDRDEADGGAYR